MSTTITCCGQTFPANTGVTWASRSEPGISNQRCPLCGKAWRYDPATNESWADDRLDDDDE